MMLKMNRTTIAACVAFALTMSAATASAAEGDWVVRFGAHNVVPKSNNSPIANVDSAASLTVSASYFYTDHIAVEVLGAIPFQHDIKLRADGSKAATTKHLPPTVFLQYNFAPNAKIRPYVGAGLNYTTFFSESTKGALAGAKLELTDSWGLAGQAGIDIALDDKWAVNVNVHYFDIDTDAKVNGAKATTVNIDPVGYGLMLSRKF